MAIFLVPASGAFLPLSGGTLSGDVTLAGQSDMRFADADSSNWVGFQGAASIGSNTIWTLPATDGSSGQALTTNGSGTLSWANAGGVVVDGGNFANGTSTVTTVATIDGGQF